MNLWSSLFSPHILYVKGFQFSHMHLFFDLIKACRFGEDKVNNANCRRYQFLMGNEV